MKKRTRARQSRADSRSHAQRGNEVFVERFIEMLRVSQGLRSDRVEAAIRAVPRHLFVDRYYPSVAGGRLTHIRNRRPTSRQLKEIYSDRSLVSHRNPPSSSSQPSLVADMLEYLDVRDGERVLEIGAGTGWNAGLLGHLAGRSGRVHTIDIQSDVADRARRHLKTAGSRNVTVLTKDGAKGHARGAPYGRIVTTVSTADIPAAWFEQLAEGGVMLVTLQEIPGDGWCQLVRFRKRGNVLAGAVVELCGFMTLTGTHGHTAYGAKAADRVTRKASGGQDATLMPVSWRVTNTPNVRRAFWLFAHLNGIRVKRIAGSTGHDAEYVFQDDGEDSVVVAGEKDMLRVYGTPRVYDRLVKTYRAWIDAGSPRRDDYALEAWPASVERRVRSGWVVCRGDAQIRYSVQVRRGSGG